MYLHINHTVTLFTTLKYLDINLLKIFEINNDAWMCNYAQLAFKYYLVFIETKWRKFSSINLHIAAAMALVTGDIKVEWAKTKSNS
jgi:hypothetical protein